MPEPYRFADDVLEKTLEELENDYWGEPTWQSRVVIECHRLRRVPLRHLNVEDLRLLIGQKIGLDYLLLIALQIMASDPWVSGDYFEGDLLDSVLRVDRQYWASRPEFKASMDQVVEMARYNALECPPDEVESYDYGVVRRLERWSDNAG